MHSRHFGFALTALTVALTLQSGSLLAQLPQPATGKDPLLGVWKINVKKSRYERGGPDKPAGTANPELFWTFTPEKDGTVRMSVYPKGLAPMPGRSYVFKWDGKEYMDPQGPGMHESVIFWRGERNLLTRLVLHYASDEDRAAHKNPKRQEWVSYALSADGKTLAINSWDEATPEYTNRQIFDLTSTPLPSDAGWPKTLGSR
jgi:hypothetical protein